jgi:NitT/TauT family transport system substrate-binding protein
MGSALAAPAIAQNLTKTSFGPTTTDISVGHAAQSSLPTTLGYWKEEGLEVDVFGVAGPTPGFQMVSSGKMDFVTLTADELLLGRKNGLILKTGYMHSREPIGRIVTLEANNVKGLADLKGKTIGMPVLQPSTYAYPAFREVGVDLEKDCKLVATGTGAPAALALRRGDISAWIAWDTAVAGLENRGLKFTTFRPSYFAELPGNFISSREDVFRNKPELFIKLCRGVAKAVHFGLHNPEAAIQIHWKLYPQTKPQTGDAATIMEETKRIFLSRFDGYKLNDAKKYGEVRPGTWERITKQMRDNGVIGADVDYAAIYTPQFIDEINKFDREAIEAQAKNWRG